MSRLAISRRDVCRSFAGLALCRADAQVTPEITRFHPELEPLVALLESTPREACAAMVAEKLRGGASYRQMLAAVFLAGIRNVDPRPPGFALHCVFIIHSAHQIGLEAPADARLLPLFYAVDSFKSSQERDARGANGGYTMREMQGSMPAPERAGAELESAMEAWDMERAERAAVALARHRSPTEAVEMLWRYGARDYRNIGHKAIFVANARRTLETIGWQHAEPVLRSLVLGLLDFGREREVNGYAFENQCYAGNLERMKKSSSRLPGNWTRQPADAQVARDILAALRASPPDEACAGITKLLLEGKAGAAAVWDAVHLAAAELRMRARAGASIVAVHAVTSANALHHAFQAAHDPQVRLLMLLQAAGWMAQFRTWAETREKDLRTFPITEMEPGEEALPADEILARIPSKADEAAGAVLRLAKDAGKRQAFLSEVLRTTAAKADEVHYYKYLAALVEDIPLVSSAWRPHLTAATVYYAKGAKDPESAPVKRAREALRASSG